MTDYVKVKIRERLSKACGGEGDVLACDVADLEAICQEVLEGEMTRTNQILGGGRKKRGVYRNYIQLTVVLGTLGNKLPI